MSIKEQVQDLSPAKCLLIGLLICTLYYFFMFDKGDEATTKINQIQSDINDKTTRLAEVKKAMGNKAAFEQEVSNLTKDLEELLKFFPASLDINDIQKEITDLMQKTNSKMVSIKESNVQSRFPGYIEHGVDLESLGSFHSLVEFLVEITKMNKVVDFRTMEFLSEGSTDEFSLISFKIKLAVFSQDPSGRKEGGALPPPRPPEGQ